MFLEKFGLKDLSDLPTVRELVELAEEPGESVNPDSDIAETESSDSPLSEPDYRDEPAEE